MARKHHDHPVPDPLPEPPSTPFVPREDDVTTTTPKPQRPPDSDDDEADD